MATEKSVQIEEPLMLQCTDMTIKVVTLEGQKENQISIYSFTKIKQECSNNSIIQAAKTNQMAVLNSAVETVKNIFDLKDEENRTVLHYLALNSSFYVFNRLMQSNQQEFEKCLKSKDVYGLQPIHYVVYRGKMEVYDQISQLQVPEKIIGMAAAGNQIQLLAKIIMDTKNCKINQNYLGNVTPLHLTCYHKSDQAAIILMKEQISLINSQDDDGNTPLHICATVDNVKLIRKIIQRGGAITIKNKQNQTPLDLAKDDATLEALKSFRFTLKSLFCQLNIKPRKRSIIQSILFLSFFLLINIGSILLLFNLSQIKEVPWAFIFVLLSILITIICFFIASQSNPGYAPPETIAQLPNLLNELEYFEICLDCYIKYPPRSKHCEFCQRCVQKYDHHCPWINNCVGKNNIQSFLVFISSLLFNFTFILILSICALAEQEYISSAKHINQTEFIILIVLTIGEFLFLIPLTNLLITQIINIIQNQTTYERLILCKPKTRKRDSFIQKMSVALK